MTGSQNGQTDNNDFAPKRSKRQLAIWGVQGLLAPIALFFASWAVVAAAYYIVQDISLAEALRAGGFAAMLLFLLSGGSLAFSQFIGDQQNSRRAMRMFGAVLGVIILFSLLDSLNALLG
ncbi:hypothetical protein [Henriciella marina]|uniref:Uncharacterized protein n=1 Tax=Henriciella marina TaxID=453851 RepID=A0ABT4LR46_9PROT|nr:hypothetical protein [Henriciella marina]MCZ4296597.1 hypothetical protein [Henriciella marina]